MRKIVATQFASLDGYMDEPGDWTFPFWTDEIGAFKGQEMADAEAMILGRRTYQAFAAVWPTVPDDQGGREMNGMRKYVASRTLTEWEWNAEGLTGDLVPAVTALKETDGGTLLVVGSSSVFNELLGAGLVDELRLLVYPVILRGSVPLFTVPERADLTLTEHQVYSTGVLGLVYSTQR